MAFEPRLRSEASGKVADDGPQLRGLRHAGADTATEALTRLAHRMTLTPDAMLPAQFHHRPPVSPEERLMLAVLEDAVACFRHGAHTADTQRRRLFMDACLWIFSRERHWPFSFENICETFGLDPGYVRCALAHWARCALTAFPGAAAAPGPTLKMEEVLACMRIGAGRGRTEQ
jgi:hypothetical protein